MTAILLLLALVVLVDVVTGIRTLRRNAPAHLPARHRDWGGPLPSHPYTAQP